MDNGPDAMKIGIVGNLPKPIGGVATTCYQQANLLISAGNQVFFYDRIRHPEKHYPPGISNYSNAAPRKFWNILKLILDFPRRWFTTERFRSFFSHWIRDLFHYHILFRYPVISFSTLLHSLEILRTFEGQDIDLFHGHHALYDSWTTQLLAQYYFRRPFIVTVYTSEFTMQFYQPWRQIVIDVCNRADAVVCISQYARECMFMAGASPRKVTVNYLGVESFHFADPSENHVQAVRQRFGLDQATPLILYTGWLIERKGPQVLLEALPTIQHLPWKAVFVGPDHGLKDTLNSIVRERNLTDRVIVSDAIPLEELTALYSLAYVFIFPTLSRDEGFGLVALEAMAHGVPVIGSRTGAIPEVVNDRQTGFLFTPGDTGELARYLQMFLSQPELRAEIGKSAKIHAASFTWEKNVDRLFQTYREVNNGYAKSI
jgi:glycosyltransferase involved in cell wall biosynthesis